MGFKFNPISGQLDLVNPQGSGTSSDNFSYFNIPSTELVTIPTNQQMILTGDLVIEGELDVDGSLVIDDFVDENNFFPPYYIQSGEVFRVANYRQFFSAVGLNIDGELQVDGILIVGA